MLAQRLDRDGRQRNAAPALLGLERVKVNASAGLLDRAAHIQARPVDVLPAQREQFAASQTRRYCEQDWHVKARAFRRAQQSRRLGFGERADLGVIGLRVFFVGGLVAYYIGENAEGTESDQSWTNVGLTARKLMVLSRMSGELQSDAVLDLASTPSGPASLTCRRPARMREVRLQAGRR